MSTRAQYEAMPARPGPLMARLRVLSEHPDARVARCAYELQIALTAAGRALDEELGDSTDVRLLLQRARLDVCEVLGRGALVLEAHVASHTENVSTATERLESAQ